MSTIKLSDLTQQPELQNEISSLLQKNCGEDDFILEQCLQTGTILQEMGVGEETITAGILYYLPEQPEFSSNLPKKIQEEISTIIKKARQVSGLLASQKNLKPRPLKKQQKILFNQQSENTRKMFFALTQDLRPIFITLANCLAEMRNLQKFPKEARQAKAWQAMEIFAPLSYGVGMLSMKGEIEDLAFPVLYPKEYNWLLEKIKDEYKNKQKELKKIRHKLARSLKEQNIQFLDIHSRTKRYFSLYLKLLRHDMDLEKIYDLAALRVIVPDIESCYQALGVIHKIWSPLYGRIKDYIASPKPNGYRSLHTTIIFGKDRIAELQIKTLAMHQEAEFGAAAHLGYKESADKPVKQNFYWMDQVQQWQSEIKDTQKIAQYLQFDLFKDQIFVFTPKGDIINLPKDATALDFAFEVHSEIGEHCEGAKINGTMAKIDQQLKTGDKISILTNKRHAPSEKWLRFVKTRKAKMKIKSFLEKAYGLTRKRTPVISTITETITEKVSLLKKMLPLQKKSPQIEIAGASGIAFKISKCCNPANNDIISAFITQGEGASVHKADCPNLIELSQKWPEKIMQAVWK